MNTNVMEQIFAIWPSLKEMAAEMGLKYQTVASWKRRGAIPAEHDMRIVEFAKKRGVEIKFSDLAASRAKPLAPAEESAE